MNSMPWQDIKNALRLTKGGPMRNALDQLWGALGIERTPATSRVAFTIAVVTLAAKMSKADGVSLDVEADAFDQVYVVPESERGNVKRLFTLAAQDVAGYQSYARQIANHLQDEPELKLSVLECLFHIACADGILHPAEDEFLADVAEIFSISQVDFKAVRRTFVRDVDSPYEILGIAPNASDEEIKARYRQLVKCHHPDTLASKGVPPEFLRTAEQRLAAITSAYEAVQVERGNRAARALEASP
jgi:DnaJ like chaperone protein